MFNGVDDAVFHGWLGFLGLCGGMDEKGEPGSGQELVPTVTIHTMFAFQIYTFSS